MLQNVIVTIGAGLAGMLLFIVSAKGSIAAVVVTYFTPLPIMIAALGWSQTVGLAAALLGTALIAVVFHPALAAIYALGFALPAWWLAYLTLLARFEAAPGAANGGAKVRREWFPIGRVVFSAAIVVSVAVGAGVLSISFTGAGFERAVTAVAPQLAPMIESLFGGPERMPSGVTAEEIATLAIRTLPVAAAASLTLLHLVNLWLAGRTVEMSHRLNRPWPSLPEQLRLPRIAGILFPLAVGAVIVVGDYPGLFAAILAAALAMALALQGLAVIHALTRKRSARPAILGALYGAVVLLMPWPLIAAIGLGLIDIAFSLRDRVLAAPTTPPKS
jgi:hypothetical protein